MNHESVHHEGDVTTRQEQADRTIEDRVPSRRIGPERSAVGGAVAGGLLGAAVGSVPGAIVGAVGGAIAGFVAERAVHGSEPPDSEGQPIYNEGTGEGPDHPARMSQPTGVVHDEFLDSSDRNLPGQQDRLPPVRPGQ